MENKYASNEKLRSAVLDSYNLSSSLQDSDFEELMILTALFFEVPCAYLSIIEPETLFLKAKYGIDLAKIKREKSFTEVLLKSGKEVLSLRYSESPEIFNQVASDYNDNYRFYAGVILRDPKGYPLGAINILDSNERELNDNHIKGLKALSNQGMKLIEYSKQNNDYRNIQIKLKQKYQELEKFASIVSHDIKSPLANIISLTELLKEENKGKFNEDTIQYLDYLVESSYSLRNYVDGILSFYRSEHILEKDYENVDLHQILQGIAKLYEVTDDVAIEYPQSAILHNVNKAALTQVFLNLVSNGLKYNLKDIRKIKINFEEKEGLYYFEVKDNGDGFPQEHSEKIFELFSTLDTVDRDGNPGSGIGLATVQKLVKSMGGEIWVKSTPGKGSCFSFTIPRS